VNDPIVELRAEHLYGGVETNGTHPERAIAHFETALAIARDLGDARREGDCLGNLGLAHHKIGRLEKAADLYERGIAILRRSGKWASEGVFVGNLAQVNQELERWDDAQRCYDEAIAALTAAGDRFSAAVIHGYNGTMHHERGELQAARACYDRAIAGLDEVRAPSFKTQFTAMRAAVDAALLRIDDAQAGFDRAEEQLRAIDDEGLRVVVGLHRGHLDLARARVAGAKGDATVATTLHRTARDRLALAPLHERPSDDVRFASRLLERAIAKLSESGETGTPDGTALTVGADAAWFVPPGGGDAVELTTRQHLRRLLGALARQRLAAPNRALDVEALFEKGWPGERAVPRARASRVHVALTSLRKRGLREVLLRRSDGYLLDPAVPLVFAGERSSAR
jgi:tetratricopeptide (TPR) repeat protein